MIYKYCPPSNYSLENLQGQKLFCRHYTDFNDPFEFWSRVVSGIPAADDIERFRSAVMVWGFEDAENAEPHEEYFESLEKTSPPLRYLFDQTRIACFGSENSSLLMWSHYADGLRGFCIGFDEAVMNSNPRETYFTDVEYMDAPPTVDSFLYAVAKDQFDYHMMAIDERKRSEAYFGPDPVTEEKYKECADRAFELMTTIWRHAFAAKPLEWCYESERRLLIQTNSEEGDTAPVLHSYPVSAVKQIIVGERMAPEYRSRLLTIVAEHFSELQVQCAVRSRDAYTLGLCPLTCLGEKVRP